MADAKEISSARRHRGVHRGSVTCLTKKLKDLEARSGDPAILAPSKQLRKNLENADANFKRQHIALIELLESTDDLGREQTALDEFDEIVDDLFICIDQLVTSCSVVPGPDPHGVVTKRLERLKSDLSTVEE